MEAIILAGGFGTRLRQMVPDVPKPMAPVAGKPFLEILLSSLARKGITRAVLSLGYMANVIVEHFGRQFCGMEIEYEIESNPLGTGGAIRMGLSRCQDDHVFIFNGDTFLDIELTDLENQWNKNTGTIIVAREVLDTSRYGRLQTRDCRVIGFAEKGVNGQGLINAGCYVLPRHALDGFAPGQSFSLETDFFPREISIRPPGLFITKGHFIDIGVPEDYLRAQKELAGV